MCLLLDLVKLEQVGLGCPSVARLKYSIAIFGLLHYSVYVCQPCSFAIYGELQTYSLIVCNRCSIHDWWWIFLLIVMASVFCCLKLKQPFLPNFRSLVRTSLYSSNGFNSPLLGPSLKVKGKPNSTIFMTLAVV